MAKLVRLLAVLLVVALLGGCIGVRGTFVTGSGRMTTTDYDFSDFTKVNVSNAFEATIDQGEGYSVSVSIDDNLVEYLDVRVTGDTLYVGLKPMVNLGFNNTSQEAKITMPDLDGLDLSGATRGRISGFSSDKLVEIEVSGASQLRGDITSGEMRVHASGASTVEIEGATGNLDAEASGASTLRLDDVTAADAGVRASGASNITVNASGRLTGNASGASTVQYVGSPSSVQVDTSGASNVRQR